VVAKEASTDCLAGRFLIMSERFTLSTLHRVIGNGLLLAMQARNALSVKPEAGTITRLEFGKTVHRNTARKYNDVFLLNDVTVILVIIIT